MVSVTNSASCSDLQLPLISVIEPLLICALLLLPMSGVLQRKELCINQILMTAHHMVWPALPVGHVYHSVGEYAVHSPTLPRYK